MCQPRLIELSYGGSLTAYYRVEDLLLHLLFNALSTEEQERFFREFKCDEHGDRIGGESLYIGGTKMTGEGYQQ